MLVCWCDDYDAESRWEMAKISIDFVANTNYLVYGKKGLPYSAELIKSTWAGLRKINSTALW
jgi:hypothetical protein